MNWAWEQELSCSPKLILMALADAADDTGYCWPKIKTVAKKCNVSERTVQRVMKDLMAGGLLELTYRYSREGRQISNNYRLLLGDQGPDKLSPTPKSIDAGVKPVSPPGVTKLCRGRGDKAMSCQQPPIEPKYESSSDSLQFPCGLGELEKGRCAALVAELDEAQAQALLDGLGRAMARGMIRTSPEQWLGGAVRAQFNGWRVQRKSVVQDEKAYQEALILKGLSADIAAVIAAKTVRQGS